MNLYLLISQLYNVGEIAKLVEIPGAFVVGAGAGPYSFVGVNSELICNIQFAEGNVIPVCNNTHIAKVDPKVSVIYDVIKDATVQHFTRK